MPPRTRVSMLELSEIADLLSVSPSDVKASLEGLVKPTRYLGRALYGAEAVEVALPRRRALRLRRAAAAKGMTLVPPERTPFGDPDLIRHWDGPKNEDGGLLPWRVGINSTLFAWWKCPEGPDHEFRRVIHRSRKRGVWTGCPYCAGRLVSVTNCLATVAPEVAAQWHPKKNGKRTPKEIVSGSSEQVWWKCPKGRDHEWRGSVAGRTGGKRLGCPFCANRRLSVTNSLARVSPRIALEWHPTKNASLRPRDLVAGSTRLVWWRCKRGPDHVWRQSPAARMSGHGCPFCAGWSVSVTNSLAAVYPQVAAEWHPTKNGKLRPNGVVPGSAKRVWWRCAKGHAWCVAINARTALMSSGGEVRGCPVCKNRIATSSNSLAATHPALSKQWHPSANGKLTPKDVVRGSRVRVWWRCKRGHEWEASVTARANRNTGCPFCSGLRVAPENALAARNKKLAAQWHPTKNGKLSPREVGEMSGKQVWWQCPRVKRHVWRAGVGQRRRNKHPLECPFCAGRRSVYAA
ncbi:MAG: zinc-ribbon domain-containing protein [Polyangiaceae bacterium]|nr:zinc-ribbon domain-containing protein [Polyangiaceae bacterium]